MLWWQGRTREPWGNGARPVAWLIMSETCATHRSQISHGGATTVKIEIGQAWTSLDVLFLCGSSLYLCFVFAYCFIWSGLYCNESATYDNEWGVMRNILLIGDDGAINGAAGLKQDEFTSLVWIGSIWMNN